MEQSPNKPQWDAEWASRFFADFTAQQITSGIFNSYRLIAEEVIAASDSADAAQLQKDLYAELPLGVMVEPADDDPSTREVWLAKIDMSTGQALSATFLNTGLTVNMDGWGFDSDQSNFFTADQAAILNQQYFHQEMNGIQPH